MPKRERDAIKDLNSPVCNPKNDVGDTWSDSKEWLTFSWRCVAPTDAV